MPYGIRDDVWAKLPPDDRAAIAATAQGQPPPLVGGYAPAPATPAPPPNLSGGIGSRTAPTGDYPVATPVMTPARAAVGKALADGRTLAGWTLASREAQVGTRQLASYPAPGAEPVPPLWETAKGILGFFEDPAEPVTGALLIKGIPEEASQLVTKTYIEHRFDYLVKKAWKAPVQPTYSQTAEFVKLWNDNPDNPAAALLRRGFAIEKDLERAHGQTRHRLLGALSSLSLVLTLKTKRNIYGATYLRQGGGLR